MALTAGMRLAQYEILSPLGAGGMGEVYRAKDTRLGREVAIKVLPERLANDAEALGRFEREAKALAALSHPNILTIFDFGADREITYAVMELLQGETLRNRINTGEIPWSRMMEIAQAIAEGLAAAHSRGIIHRDLKPENIFLVSGGGVKILDFGLARLDQNTTLQGESKLATVSKTDPGTVLGTAGYMSPEQVRGQAVDFRSDIFSLGCVLYEMASGVSPFVRNTTADTVAAILNFDPPELSATAKGISPEMDHVILHCLEKNPDDRFQSTRDLAFDLKEIATGTRLTKPVRPALPARGRLVKIVILAAILCAIAAVVWWQINRQSAPVSAEKIPVAVADFLNETGDKELDGLSGMLITSLEQSRRLAVMTRSRMLDVMKQIGKEDSEKIDEHLGREICKQSNVNALIIASIRKFDQLYTIDLKVLDPQKSEYLFTAKAQGTGKASVPGMIDQLSEETRRGLNEKVIEIQAANKKVTEVTTSNLEAYQHFFKGEELINKLKFPEAEAEFRKAVQIDPEFALAYLRMSYAISWSNLDRAKEPLSVALKHKDKLPKKDQLLMLAIKASYDRDLESARRYITELLSQYPEEKEALFLLGDWGYHFGNYQQGAEYFKKVLSLDPTFERAMQHLTWAYEAMDRYDDAVRTAENYLNHTKSGDAFQILYQAYSFQGNYPGMEALSKRAEEVFPNEGGVIRGKADLYRFEGKFDLAEKECRLLLDKSRNIDDRLNGYGCLYNLYLNQGMYAKAVDIKKQQIDLAIENKELDPVANHYADLAYCEWLRRNQAEATKWIEEALKYADDSNEVLHSLFDTLNDMGRSEDAARIAEKSLWGHRAYLDETVRAYKELHNRNYANAAKDLSYLTQHALPYDRNYSYYQLARCYILMKNYDAAIQTLKTALSIPFTQQQWQYGPELYLMAQAYEKKGDRKSADEYSKKFSAVWKNPDPEAVPVIEP